MTIKELRQQMLRSQEEWAQRARALRLVTLKEGEGLCRQNSNAVGRKAAASEQRADREMA